MSQKLRNNQTEDCEMIPEVESSKISVIAMDIGENREKESQNIKVGPKNRSGIKRLRNNRKKVRRKASKF